MDEGMDSGDVLAQQSITVPDGISYEQLELQCASIGGTLLAQSVWDLYEGRANPQPQDEAQSSYHSFPQPEDFAVYAKEWDARHVYNFIAGVGHWDEPIALHTGETVLQVRNAISYSQKPPDNMFNDVRNDTGNTALWVRCKVGWVCVRVESDKA
jgi:methionyl-tRNA formyltransferase